MGHQSLTSKNRCFLSVALEISTAQYMLYFKQLSENYLLVCNKPNWIILCFSLVIPVGIIFNEFSNITWINAKWRTSHNFPNDIFKNLVHLFGDESLNSEQRALIQVEIKSSEIQILV